MFSFPSQAKVDRPIPKTRIYDHARPTKSVRERFVTEVESIVWSYKLAPETVNLPASPGVAEIQVFTVFAKTPDLSEVILRTIDTAIPSPLFFCLRHGERVRAHVAYKRPSEAATSDWVVEEGFDGPWHPVSTSFPPLPLALDLGQLYASLLTPFLQPPARLGESMPEHLARLRDLRRLTREADGLAARLARESQFNRKIELNTQLRTLNRSIKSLS